MMISTGCWLTCAEKKVSRGHIDGNSSGNYKKKILGELQTIYDQAEQQQFFLSLVEDPQSDQRFEEFKDLCTKLDRFVQQHKDALKCYKIFDRRKKVVTVYAIQRVLLSTARYHKYDIREIEWLKNFWFELQAKNMRFR